MKLMLYESPMSTLIQRLSLSVLLTALVAPFSLASPLVTDKVYGCVVDGSHVLDVGQGILAGWRGAPRSFSLTQKLCSSADEDNYTPAKCANPSDIYLQVGPREVVVSNFGASELLFGSTLNPNIFVNNYRLAVSLSFVSEADVVISVHDKTEDDRNAIFALSASCFLLE